MAIAFSLTTGEFAAGVRLGIRRTEGEIAPGVQITIHRTVGAQPDVQHIAFKLYAGEAAAPTFAASKVFAGSVVFGPLTALGASGASGSVSLSPLSARGNGPGSGSVTILPLFALGSSPPGGNVTLELFTASGTGQERINAGAVVLLPITGIGTGSFPTSGVVNLLPFTAVGTGSYPPAGTVSLLPLTATGTGALQNDVSGNWTLPLFSGTGSYLTQGKYTGNFRLPLFQKTGTLLNGAAFIGDFKLPLFQNAGTLLNGSGFSGAWKLPMFQASGQVLLGTTFAAAWTLPMFAKSGQFGTYRYSGAWVLPLFGLSGQVVSEIEQTYRAWPINLKNLALTQYENYAFNSMARFNGEYLAAGSGGLMSLTGPDDAGTKIDWRIRFGEHDFGIEELKRIPEAFCTYRSAGDMKLRVIIDGGDTYEYTLLATGNTGMATNRTKIGKAIRSNYYTLELQGNVKFDLQNITLHPVVLSRKIGRPPVTRVFTGRMQLPSVTNIGQF